MAKQSAADLKKEAQEWNDLIAKAKKKDLNFALAVGKEGGVVLAADMKKSSSVMLRQTKANGGSAKACQGVMAVSGKRIEFRLDSEDFPGELLSKSKKHLKAMKLGFKVAFVTPDGAAMGDEDDEADDPEPKGGPTEAPAIEDDETERKETLTAQLKELVPQVQALDTNLPETANLFTVVKKAAAGLKSNDLDSVDQLLEAAGKLLEVAVARADAAKDLMAEAMEAYGPIGPGLDRLKSEAGEAVAKKAEQIQAKFNALIEAGDPKKALALLKVAKDFVDKELGALEKEKEGFFDSAAEFFDDVVETVSDVVEDIAETVSEVIEDVVDQLSDIAEEADDAIDKALLPAKQREALNALETADPETYQTVMDTLDEMEKDGRIDASPDSIQDSRDTYEAASKTVDTAKVALDKAKADLAAVTPAPGSNWAKAEAAMAKVETEWKNFKDSLPDPASMDETQRAAMAEREAKFQQLLEKAQTAANAAEAEAKREANEKLAEAQASFDTADAAKKEANEELKGKEGKKAMLDALTFGRLSPDAKPAFKAEDKQKFIEVFAKDGALARNAMDLAARSEDPSVIAQNAGYMADKLNDGFAAPDGQKLDLPEEQLRAMASNALQLGATEGQAYFDGFKDYMASGAQLKPDPHGGLDAPDPDPKKESLRKNKIALARTTSVGTAVLGTKTVDTPDGPKVLEGQVDFDSPEGKAAMDHMMFHPGSLNTFSPHMTAKMTEMRDLFAGPDGAAAQKLIDDTAVPHPPMAGVVTGSKIIAGTMGKKPGEIDDGDAKAAVLSAMMTPLSQGPVGSCFSTAPVRAIRESDPLRAMEEFQQIATTGQYKTADNRIFPADTNPPVGENPLMRSWEYSVATAAAEKADSKERRNLEGALMDPNALGALSTVIPAEKWNDKVEPGKLPVPGIKKKLDKAISEKFKFEYNAGPEVGAPDGGGGDGHSSQGGYQVMYKGKAITSEAEMVAALKEVALEVTGYEETSDEGKKVLDIFVAKDGSGNPVPGATSPVADAIITSYGGTVGDGKDRKKKKAPWNLASGGMEYQTAAVLEGKPYTRSDILGKKPSGVARSARTSQIIQSVLGLPNGKDLEPVGTGGRNAAHAFNALPNHPSNAKIQGPDMAAKIQSELIAPGQAVAGAKLPAERAARMFDDQIKSMAEKADEDERPLLLAALKNRPTTEMTPQEINDKIQAEVAAYRDVLAQKKADAYEAKFAPTADAALKAKILAHFKKRVKEQVDNDIGSYMMERLPLPEVVIADSNWGGPEGQTLFVAAPDPRTGELILWKKDEYSGEMKPLGQNWEDGTWDTMAPTPPAPATP